MSSNNKNAIRFKIFFVAIFLILVGFYVYDKNKDIQKNQETEITDNTNKEKESTAKKVTKKDSDNKDTKSKIGKKFENPIKITPGDISNSTGESFSKKYYGKWIKLDGVIEKSEDLQGMLGLQTKIKAGTIENNVEFKDNSSLSIFANKNTFSKDLQDFNKKYKSKKPIQVEVVAKVATYNKDVKRVLLMKNPNIEGKEPSIKQTNKDVNE